VYFSSTSFAHMSCLSHKCGAPCTHVPLTIHLRPPRLLSLPLHVNRSTSTTMANAHNDTIAARSEARGPRRFEVLAPIAPPGDWDAFAHAQPPSTADYAIKWNFNEVGDLGRGNGLREYRPKVVAVWMRKGGVAKTTTTFQLGHALASVGCRTMMVDLDSQQDLTEVCFRAVAEATNKTDVQEYVSSPLPVRLRC
jgi:Mrp family chromosome partitioning ATPase